MVIDFKNERNMSSNHKIDHHWRISKHSLGETFTIYLCVTAEFHGIA